MYQMQVEGTLTIAKLNRQVKGGAVYGDITFRRSDGAVECLGSMRVAEPLAEAMVPGTRGRFFFVEMAGVRALHGFQGMDGRAIQHVSLLYERIAMILAALNIALFLAGLIAEDRIGGGYAVAAIAMTTAAIMLTMARRACIKAFQTHLPKAPESTAAPLPVVA